VIVKFFANNNSSKLQPAMVLVLFLSGLALGFAARVEELLEVSEAVSEAVAVKQDETVQGVTYDESKGRTCTSTSWTFCKSPAVWRGHSLDDGDLCCLQGHYTCVNLGITGNCHAPKVWTGEHCCTKVATTTTTTPGRLLQHGYHNGGYHNGGYHNGGYWTGGYNEFRGKACKGRNELGSFQGSSVRTCQSKCDMDPKCVSFEWEAKRRLCQVSTSCTERYLATYPHMVIYIKKYNSNTNYNKYHLAPKGAATCDFGEIVPKRDCLSAVKQLAPRPLGRPSLQEGQGGRCLDGSWGSVPTGCSAQTGGDWAAHHKTGRCRGGAGWQQGVNKIYQLTCQTTTYYYNYYNH
jgi:hypothetical protein